MLKAVPNKNAGFIILLTSIFTFFFFGEIRNLTTFTRLMDYNNGFSISSFFLSSLSFLWIGAQFPQEKFLSYARILTLDFYFLIMCILFSPPPQTIHDNSRSLLSWLVCVGGWRANKEPENTEPYVSSLPRLIKRPSIAHPSFY